MKNSACSDLVVRLDEDGQRFIFFFKPREQERQPVEVVPFSVEITFEELKSRGADAAERLVGESILGVFDTLTFGRLDLPKHYIDV